MTTIMAPEVTETSTLIVVTQTLSKACLINMQAGIHC